MLSDEQSAELRALLEARQATIRASAYDAASFSRDRDRTRVGRDSVDESAEEALYGTKLRLADRENALLNQISQSLLRLQKGELDECEDCGDQISFARLRASPMTTLCIACQEDREEQA